LSHTSLLGSLALENAMHIISRKALHAFAQQHPDSRTALDTWFRIMKTNDFTSFHHLHIPGITPSRPITRQDILESIQEGRRSYD
jgi:hypothetical protein